MATITTNGVELYYERRGSGEPVLFVHGYLFSAESFRAQMDALVDRYDVIGIDLRGQHRSEVTEAQAGYDLWNQAEDVHGVIEGLGIAPCHYVGLSMGGMIALRLLQRHPGDIRSLVLLDTQAGPEDPDKVERYEAMNLVAEAGQLEAVAPAIPPIFFADAFVRDHPGEVRAWLDRILAANPLGFVRALRGVNGRDDVSSGLPSINVPTLVIHGTDDAAIEPEKAAAMAAAIPGARLELVEGAGHMSSIDHPVETSALIQAFLAGLPAAAVPG